MGYLLCAGFHLRCGHFDGIHDVFITGTTAVIADEATTDLFAADLGIILD